MTKGQRHGDEGLSIGRKSMEPAYAFMKRCRAHEKPFFLWYAPMLPHDPHDPPADLVEHYQSKTDSVHVARFERGEVELFDVATDPRETKNVAATEPVIVKELQKSLDSWWNPHGS